MNKQNLQRHNLMEENKIAAYEKSVQAGNFSIV